MGYYYDDDDWDDVYESPYDEYEYDDDDWYGDDIYD